MLTQAQVLDTVRQGREAACIDQRDYRRLSSFFPVWEWPAFGFTLIDGATPPEPEPWTQEAFLERLRGDVAFGFEKALHKRGISSSLQYDVVRMWLWVLDDPLQHFEGYAQYGLPLFKAVAVKYGWPNPIGEKVGDEFEFSADADE